VPPSDFVRAVAINSTNWQVGTIAGPALGGVLYGWGGGAHVAYAASATLVAGALGLLLALRVRTGRLSREALSWPALLAGVRFVSRQRLLLGSLTLDLFAVLLGGAVALLPAVARDVLHTGPWGLGLLRSAPAAGAALVALWLAFHPLERDAGRKMFFAVGLFGLATVVFGLSRWLPLSLLALAVLGAADMVSVVVRHTLELTVTPDPMRGRVGAVNMMCIGASNELGEFESGLAAHLFGVVPAVVLGGLGTLVVVGLWAWAFPELRRVDSLSAVALQAQVGAGGAPAPDAGRAPQQT
jgi:MFS family permease